MSVEKAEGVSSSPNPAFDRAQQFWEEFASPREHNSLHSDDEDPFPAVASTPPEAVSPFSPPGSLSEQLRSGDWKVRVAGYKQLLDSPAQFVPELEFPFIYRETTPASQEAALKLLSLADSEVFSNQEAVKAVMQSYGATPKLRPSLVLYLKAAISKNVPVYVVLSELLGSAPKKPLVLGSVSVILELTRELGPIDVHTYLDTVCKLLSEAASDRTLREVCYGLLVELALWGTGVAGTPHLALAAPQKKELEQRVADAKAAGESRAWPASGVAGAGTRAGAAKAATQVDIWRGFKSEQLASDVGEGEKWQTRRAALAKVRALIPAATSSGATSGACGAVAPRVARPIIVELAAILSKIVKLEQNMPVFTEATLLIAELAAFHGPELGSSVGRTLFQTLLPRVKEKTLSKSVNLALKQLALGGSFPLDVRLVEVDLHAALLDTTGTARHELLETLTEVIKLGAPAGTPAEQPQSSGGAAASLAPLFITHLVKPCLDDVESGRSAAVNLLRAVLLTAGDPRSVGDSVEFAALARPAMDAIHRLAPARRRAVLDQLCDLLPAAPPEAAPSATPAAAAAHAAVAAAPGHAPQPDLPRRAFAPRAASRDLRRSQQLPQLPPPQPPPQPRPRQPQPRASSALRAGGRPSLGSSRGEEEASVGASGGASGAIAWSSSGAWSVSGGAEEERVWRGVVGEGVARRMFASWGAVAETMRRFARSFAAGEAPEGAREGVLRWVRWSLAQCRENTQVVKASAELLETLLSGAGAGAPGGPLTEREQGVVLPVLVERLAGPGGLGEALLRTFLRAGAGVADCERGTRAAVAVLAQVVAMLATTKSRGALVGAGFQLAAELLGTPAAAAAAEAAATAGPAALCGAKLRRDLVRLCVVQYAGERGVREQAKSVVQAVAAADLQTCLAVVKDAAVPHDQRNFWLALLLPSGRDGKSRPLAAPGASDATSGAGAGAAALDTPSVTPAAEAEATPPATGRSLQALREAKKRQAEASGGGGSCGGMGGAEAALRTTLRGAWVAGRSGGEEAVREVRTVAGRATLEVLEEAAKERHVWHAVREAEELQEVFRKLLGRVGENPERVEQILMEIARASDGLLVYEALLRLCEEPRWAAEAEALLENCNETLLDELLAGYQGERNLALLLGLVQGPAPAAAPAAEKLLAGLCGKAGAEQVATTRSRLLQLDAENENENGNKCTSRQLGG